MSIHIRTWIEIMYVYIHVQSSRIYTCNKKFETYTYVPSYITICDLWFMYTKMTNYHHFKSIHEIFMFSRPKSEGLVRHRVFCGASWARLGLVRLLVIVSLCLLVFSWLQRKDLYELTHTKKMILHPVPMQEILGAKKKHDKPTPLSCQGAGFESLTDQPHMACWRTIHTHIFSFSTPSHKYHDRQTITYVLIIK